MDYVTIMKLSIGIICGSSISNIIAVYFRQHKNNKTYYSNLFETNKTKELLSYFRCKGIKLKIYVYKDNCLNASLLPSSKIIVVLSKRMLDVFDKKDCISIIYHELGHYNYRRYHIQNISNYIINILFISTCLFLLYCNKIIFGTSAWGILAIFPFEYLFMKGNDKFQKKLFLNEEFYADRYSSINTGGKNLEDIYIKIIHLDNNANKLYISKKIENLKKEYDK
jgi:Zn-dependent protease with chaperone function